MDISIVIPLYNGAKFIEQTLRSVLGQSKLPAEIVVVDDGSKDDSYKLVSSFAEVKLLRNTDKHQLQGAAYARNFGLRHAQGTYVAFLDQDDIWHPEHLAILSQILERYPESSAAVASCSPFEQVQELAFETPILNAVTYDPWAILPSNYISTPSAVLLRRNSLLAVGGWPTKFTVSDFHTWLLLACDCPIMFNLSPTVGYRIHASSNSHDLRLKKIQLLIADTTGAIEDSASGRIKVRPEDGPWIQSRKNLLQDMSSLVESVVARDVGLLTKAAMGLEKLLLAEASAEAKVACRHLFWLLRPVLEAPSGQESLLLLAEYWPLRRMPTTGEYSFFYAQFIRSLSRRYLVSRVLQQPFNIRRGRLLFDFLALKSQEDSTLSMLSLRSLFS